MIDWSGLLTGYQPDNDDIKRKILFRTQDPRLQSALRPEPLLDIVDGEATRCRKIPNLVAEINDGIALKGLLLDRGYVLEGSTIKSLARMRLHVEGEKLYDTEPPILCEWQRYISECVTLACRQLGTFLQQMDFEERVSKVRPCRTTQKLMWFRTLTTEWLCFHLDRCAKHDKYRPEYAVQDRDVFYWPVSSKLSLWAYKQGCAYTLQDRVTPCYGDLLRCINDLACSRHLVLLACDIAHAIGNILYPEQSYICKLFRIGDLILSRLGNSGFAGLKNLEPLIIGELTKRDQQGIVQSKFLQQMKIDTAATLAQAELDLLSELFSEAAIKGCGADLSQMFGLFRIWGHPLVNVLNGVLKVKDVAQKPKQINTDLAQQVAWKFKETFFIRYYLKEGRWPNHSMVQIERSEVSNALHTGCGLDTKSLDYRLSDWKYVTCLQTFDPRALISGLSTLNDKAACLTKPEIIAGLKRDGRYPASDRRRMLLEYLMREDDTLFENLAAIDREGIEEDSRVIGVTPKERELKIDPRLFSLMTPKVREYMTATEKLIAEAFLPYLPGITMADTGRVLKKKMARVSRATAQRRRGVVHIVVNIDFQRWNLHMRNSFVRPLFREMDHLFGYQNLIQRTHEVFAASTFFVSDNIYTPTLDEFLTCTGKGCWDRHMGGMEGLRQKGWTIATLCMLLLISEETGVQVEILGQGDNQVLLLSLHYAHETPEGKPSDSAYLKLKKRFDSFMKLLYDRFQEVGLPIKIEESWTSTELFAYGKNLYYRGVCLPMCLKRISRMYYFANELYPTVFNEISSIYACAEAAIESDIDGFVALAVALTETLRCLLDSYRWTCTNNTGIHPDNKGWKWRYRGKDGLVTMNALGPRSCGLLKSPIQLLEFLSLLGTQLGGYPTQNIYSLMIRGTTDQLTQTIGFINEYLVYNTKISTLVRSSLLAACHPKINNKKDPVLFVEDPYQANLCTPTSADYIIRSGAERVLKSEYVQNKTIKNMMAAHEQDREPLAVLLWKASPQIPRFSNIVYECSPTGISNKTIGRFTNTRSLQKVARSQRLLDSQQIEARISKFDCEFFNSVLHRANGVDDTFECAFVRAREIRAEGWGRSDVVGVSAPAPFMYLHAYPNVTGNCALCKAGNHDYVYTKIDLQCFRSPLELLTTVGRNVGYYGSETYQKVSSKTEYEVDCCDPPFKLAKRLASHFGWIAHIGSRYGNFLEKRISCLTNIDPLLLIGTTINVDSSTTHRIQDIRSSKGGSPGTNPTPFTHINVSTSTLGKYSHGTQDYPIYFQAVICYAQLLTALKHYYTSPSETKYPSFHLHVCCTKCLPVLEDQYTDFPDSITAELESFNHIKYDHNPNLYSQIDCSTLVKRERLRPAVIINQLSALTPDEQSRIFSDLLVQTALGHVIATLSDRKKAIEDRQSFPYIWYFKCRPIRVFTRFAFGLACICAETFNFFLFADLLANNLLDSLIIHAIRVVSNMDVSYFWPLTGLFFTCPTSRRLAKAKDFIMFPSGTPPSMTATAGAVKQSVLKYYTTLLVGHNIPDSTPIFKYELLDLSVTSRMLTVNTLAALAFSRVAENQRECLKILNQIKVVITQSLCSTNGSSRYLSAITHELLEREVFAALTVEEWQTDLAPVLKEALSVTFINTTLDALRKSSPWPVNEDLHMVPLNLPHCTGATRHWSLKTGTVYIDKEHDPVLPELRMVHPARHYLKPFKNTTTAYMKWSTIFSTQALSPQGGVALCCGDGDGGCSALVARLFPHLEIAYNSLLDLDDNEVSYITDFVPAAFQVNRIPDDRIINFRQLREGVSDLTDPTIVQVFTEALQGRLLSLVTCDAEGGGWDNIEKISNIVDNLCTTIELHGAESCCFIIKTYCSVLSHVNYVLARCQQTFQDVSLVTSCLSSVGSSECFVVAIGKRSVYRMLITRGQGEISLSDVQYLTEEQAIEMINSRSRIEDGDITISKLLLRHLHGDLLLSAYVDVMYARLWQYGWTSGDPFTIYDLLNHFLANLGDYLYCDFVQHDSITKPRKHYMSVDGLAELCSYYVAACLYLVYSDLPHLRCVASQGTWYLIIVQQGEQWICLLSQKIATVSKIHSKIQSGVRTIHVIKCGAELFKAKRYAIGLYQWVRALHELVDPSLHYKVNAVPGNSFLYSHDTLSIVPEALPNELCDYCDDAVVRYHQIYENPNLEIQQLPFAAAGSSTVGCD